MRRFEAVEKPGEDQPPGAAPDAPLDREARLSRIILVAIPVLSVALILGFRFALDQRPVKVQIARQIAQEIAARSQSGVRVGALELGWSLAPCIGGLEIFRSSQTLKVAAAAESACVTRWRSAVGSGFRTLRVELQRPRLELEGLRAPGSATTLVEVNPASPENGTEGESGPGRGPGSRAPASLIELSLGFDDLQLVWSNLDLPARLKDGALGPLDGEVTLQRRGPDSALTLSVREPKTGLAFAGRATPTRTGFDLGFSVEGDLGPKIAPLLDAAGLDVKALPIRGQVGVIYERASRKLLLDLDLVEEGLDLASRVVSSRRLTGFSARQKLRAELDLNTGTFHMEDGLIEVNGVPLVVSLDVKRGEKGAELSATLSLSTVSLDRLLRSIPGTTPLDDLHPAPSVLFALTASLSGLLRDPETWKVDLDHRVIGIGAGGANSGLEYLLAPRFSYRPLTPTGRSEVPLELGKATPNWVAYAQIPYAMRRSVQVAEDASFFTHHGIDLDEIRAAVIESVTTGERTRGGSTLTQQLVKNLFLSRERTALRKVQELILTFLVESSLTKEQIFELYLNVIEWGPNLHGLRPAALHYFGKSPASLSPREAAYLALIIPGPMLYHAHYEQGFVSPKFQPKVEALVDKLVKLGTLKPEDVKPADQDPIRFSRR